MLSSFLIDETDGRRVDPRSYQWEINRPGQGWDDEIKAGELAKAVSGRNTKDMQLDGLVVAEADQLFSAYQVRCVAQYNDTYFTVSRGFAVNVHRTFAGIKNPTMHKKY